MKKIYFSVILILISLSSFTQITQIENSETRFKTISPTGQLQSLKTEDLSRRVGYVHYNSSDGNAYDIHTDSASVTYVSGYYYDKWQYYSWDGTMWNDFYYYVWTYNDDWYTLDVYGKMWDGDSYEFFNQTSYVYDDENHVLTFLYEIWDGTDWVNSYQYLYTYNEDGYQLTYTYQTWSGTEWENNTNYIYERNDENQLVNYIVQSGVGGVWVNSIKITYEYNDAGYNENSVTLNWTGTDWENVALNTYEYNDDNQVTVNVTKVWAGTWVNNNKLINTYNEIGQLASATTQHFDIPTLSWLDFSRSVNVFDGTYNLISATNQTYTDEWENSTRVLYGYDANNVYDYEEYQNWDGTSWKYNYYFRWFNELFEDIFSNSIANSLLVYPMPFNSTFMIELPEQEISKPAVINLFDLTGRLVYTKQIIAEHNNIINADQVPAGNYIYFVKGAISNYSGRLTKVQ